MEEATKKSISSLMGETRRFPPPPEFASKAYIKSFEQYQEMYKRSLADPNGFWGEAGKRIDWIKPYTKVKNTSYAPDNVSIKWYEDGTLNAAAGPYAGLDRFEARRKLWADMAAAGLVVGDKEHVHQVGRASCRERV